VVYHQTLKQNYMLKKLWILLMFIFSSNALRAEHFYDFYLQDLDLSEYPIVKVKGGVLEFEYDNAVAESITFFENEKEVDVNVVFKRLQNIFQVITITYRTELSKEAIRVFHLRYDNHGFHNGSEGQFFEYNPKKNKYIKEISEYRDEEIDLSISNYINNILINYERDGLEEMYVLALNGLLVRELPISSSKVIGKLDFGTKTKASLQQYGTEVKVTENEDLNLKIEGQFRKINFKGKEGYVFDGYLTTFSFFESGDKENSCAIIYDSQDNEKNNQAYRIEREYDKYGEYLLLKHISLEKTYLIAQAIFENFKNLRIKEEQDYGEIYNGWKYYKFDYKNFMFKLFKYDQHGNQFGYHKIYFECY
jgi:hypothetical protein